MKVYISPSDQWSNIVAGGQHSEAKHCTDIANALENYLKQNGYVVKVGDNTKESSYINRALESNNWGADLHVCIHTNAGGGKGTLVLTYPYTIDNKYVVSIYREVASLTPTEDKGVRSADLYEINTTNCVCVYIEVDFHDNLEIEKWIDENINNIAKAIAKGICFADGKSFKSDTANQSTPPAHTTHLYKVQAGAFKNGRNAAIRVKELYEIGVPSFYYFDDSDKLYKVQAGAYSKKENAKEQVRVLKNKGFSSFITH